MNNRHLKIWFPDDLQYHDLSTNVSDYVLNHIFKEGDTGVQNQTSSFVCFGIQPRI
jgi:hypothetical protein